MKTLFVDSLGGLVEVCNITGGAKSHYFVVWTDSLHCHPAGAVPACGVVIKAQARRYISTSNFIIDSIGVIGFNQILIPLSYISTCFKREKLSGYTFRTLKNFLIPNVYERYQQAKAFM